MRPFVRLACRHLPAVALGLAGTVAMASAAFAMDTCAGEFSASPLQPLPTPAVIGVDLSDSSPVNTALADAFTSGLHEAGAQVPGSAPATVKLRLTWQVLGQGGSNPGQGVNPLVPSLGNSDTFMAGGIDRAMPDMPNYDALAPGQSAQSGLLVFRAEARDLTGATIYWIGSAQCTLTGGDNTQLAYQLGQLIGGAIGQRRSRVAM